MKPKLRVVLAASTAIALSVGLAGCGGGDNAPSAPSGADAPALVRQATEASKKVEHVHFSLQTTGKVPNMPISKVDGDLNIKPTVSSTGTATVNLGKESTGKYSYVDGTMYSDLLTGKVVDYGKGDSIYDVSILFDADKGVPNILSKLANPVAAGSEDINSQATVKIVGTVPAGDIAAISGSRLSKDSDKNVPVSTTVWIQKDGDHQLVRLSMIPAEKSTVQLTFAKWGQQVNVTKPSVAPVETLPGGPEAIPAN